MSLCQRYQGTALAWPVLMAQSAFPPDLTSRGHQGSNKLIKFICFSHTLESHQGSVWGPIDFKYFLIYWIYSWLDVNVYWVQPTICEWLKYPRKRRPEFTFNNTGLITRSCKVVVSHDFLCILLFLVSTRIFFLRKQMMLPLCQQLPALLSTTRNMTGKKCLPIQKLQWEYHFFGRNQSFREQNAVARSFPKINSLFASTIKSPQTIVCTARFQKQMAAPHAFPS